MENASKALMIAGGVLLAILTISLIVYMMTSVNSMAERQDAAKVAEQVNIFNKEYEAYNKRKMYGTDVITVIKKAINFNGGLNANETDYFVNIELQLTENFVTTTRTVTTDGRGNTHENIVDNADSSLDAGTYQLKSGTNKISQDMLIFFSGNPNDDYEKEIDNYNKKTIETYKYSALTNFKRAIFECTKVEYNPSTGRINLMVFEQRKKATY